MSTGCPVVVSNYGPANERLDTERLKEISGDQFSPSALSGPRVLEGNTGAGASDHILERSSPAIPNLLIHRIRENGRWGIAHRRAGKIIRQFQKDEPGRVGDRQEPQQYLIE